MFNASVDSVDITVFGVSGHGAYPHKTKDPIVLASQMVIALQTIVSREVSPTESAVVTVGKIVGGTKRNVIPESVKLELTVRTQTDEVRRKVLSAIRRIAEGTAKAYGISNERLPKVELLKDESTPMLYNDPKLVDVSMQAIRDQLEVSGAGRIVHRDATMGGEDFAYYGGEDRSIPTFMFRLGSVPQSFGGDSAKWPSLHSSKYLPDYERAIPLGVEAMSAAAIQILQ